MIERLQKVFREVFLNNQLLINPATSAKNISMWDSLTHLELIAAVEKEFKIKFSFDEVMNFSSVADLITVIQTKLNIQT